MDGWIEVRKCPACGFDKLVNYKVVTSAPALVIDFCGGGLPVVTSTNYIQCVVCDLVIQSPRMSDERIAQYYASGLYRDTLGISVEYMDDDERRRSSDVACWLDLNKIKPISHLDIGASRGYLLQNVNAEIQYGLDINKEYGGSTSGDVGTYELVTAIHVLEHVTDPMKELQLYKSLSSDKVVIEVPGKNCKGGPLRFAHTFYYPPETLANMIQAAGMLVLGMADEVNTRVLAQI